MNALCPLQRRLRSLPIGLQGVEATLEHLIKVRYGRAKGSYSAPIVAPTKISVADLAIITITRDAAATGEAR